MLRGTNIMPAQVNQQILEILFNHLPINYYWLNKDGIVLRCNKHELSALKLRSFEDIIGKHSLEVFAPEAWENSKSVMETRETQILDETHINDDGTEKNFLSIKSPLYDTTNKDIIGLLGISIDITDRKRAEEYRLKTETAQKAAEFAGLMAGSIAHELRTPLNSITSLANNLLVHLPILLEVYEAAKKKNLRINNLPIEEIRSWHLDLLNNCAQNIFAEVGYSNTMINMLLTNLKSIKIDPSTFELCSASTCIKNALERYPLTNQEKELISFKENGENVKNQDFTFRGNPLMMVHVLFNLIKNALYYVRKAKKGEIVIWLLPCRNNKSSNELHFRDTGYGIPEDILPQIFEPFFSKTHNSTGVGLSFCKLIMNGFGGDITCITQENKFTEFVLTFPTV